MFSMTQAKIQHLSDELSQSDEPGWMEKEGLLLVASALNGRRFSPYPESPGPWLDYGTNVSLMLLVSTQPRQLKPVQAIAE